MKPNKITILFLIILFTIIQCTTLNYFKIFKLKPDILLAVIIFFSLTFGKNYGISVGALCGLFSEITSGIPEGFAVLVYSFGGLILGYLGKWIYPAPVHKGSLYNHTIFRQIFITFVFTFTVYLFLFFLFKIFNINPPLYNTLLFIILPASFYTACVSPILFLLFRTIFNPK